MPGEKHRIVIDTNLWISFLLTRDFAGLDELLSNDQVILLISQELIEEIIEVAERPKFRKYFGIIELTDLIINLKEKAEFIAVSSKITICRDKKDNFLLSLAVDGHASHLLTGDKDLLVLHPFQAVQIIQMTNYLSKK